MIEKCKHCGNAPDIDVQEYKIKKWQPKIDVMITCSIITMTDGCKFVHHNNRKEAIKIWNNYQLGLMNVND